ncbi:glycoside hydrolase family protein, partial [Klebsiella pneumoniae]|uniref:glycoside hydrolase family protein n=1 Tax=Klebsiella pneumoniae TaxID=573 RepID=UPI00272F0CBD
RKTNGTITKAESQSIFAQDIAKSEKGIKGNATLAPIYNGLDETRKMALINMVFQMGVLGVAGFPNSLKLIAAKDWNGAATNLAQSK